MTNKKDQQIKDWIQEEAIGEVLKITEDISGYLVIQNLPDDSGSSLYHVTVESQIDGTQSLHWAYLGPAGL